MTTKRLKLSSKQTIAFDHLEHDNTVTEVFYGGAAGGGKSFFGCFWQLYRRTKYPGTVGLIGRSVLKNMKLTTLKTFFRVASDYFGLSHGNGFKYNSQEGIIKFDNGSEIFLKDLFHYPSDPDFTSLGSLEVTDVFIDECTEITKKAFEIINSRIRFKTHLTGGPKILLAGNPAHNWVKFRYVLDEKNIPVKLEPYQQFIPASVEDNPDTEFKALYRQQLEKLNRYDRQRLLYGDWVVNKNDHPFFYEYSDDKHVSKALLEIDEAEPLWLSFDFNINPTTAVIGQKIPGKGLFIYRLHQVKGGTRRLCEHLKTYEDYILRITGDRSGNSGNTAAGVLVGGQLNTDYNIIREELNISPRQIVSTQKANKRHTHSRSLCNEVLFHVPMLISSEGCEGLINDLQTAQPTNQGKLLKDRDQHKQDAGDAFRYLINAWFPRGMKDVNAFKKSF